MALQIVHGAPSIVLAEEAEAVVSPLCRGQPPLPRLDGPASWALLQALEGVAGWAAAEQRQLGLRLLDPLLLRVQLPSRLAHLAEALAYGGQVRERCLAAVPDPVVPALAALSRGARSLAVDLRFHQDRRGAGLLAAAAASEGVRLQLLVNAPMELPGEVVVAETAHLHVRRRHMEAGGTRAYSGLPVSLRELRAGEAAGGWEAYDFRRALGRALEVLGLDAGVVAELVEAGQLSYRALADMARPEQVGRLASWGLIRRTSAGWRATAKLLTLWGMYVSAVQA